MNIQTKKSKGFTLIETLIVSSMIALISVSLYGSFSNGLKLWNRSQQFMLERDMAIFFDKINRELRNSFSYSRIYFIGRGNILRFPTIVRTLEDPNLNPKQDNYVNQIGSVEYRFDRTRKKLFKRTANYGLAVDQKYLTEELVLSDVSSVEFLYYYFDGKRIQKGKQTDILPRVVQIAVTYADDKGRERKVTTTVYVPLGDNISYETAFQT